MSQQRSKQFIKTTSGDFQAYQITQSDLGITTSDGFTIVQDTTGNIVFNQREASKFIDFRMAGDSALLIDGIGNSGFGVTPESSWSSVYSAIQLGGGSAWFSHKDGTGTASTFLAQNTYNNGSVWKSIVNNEASYFQMKDGAFYFNNDTSVSGADETLTPATLMTIDSSGNVGINTDDPGGKLDVLQTGNITTAQFGGDATSSGQQIYGFNTDSSATTGQQILWLDYTAKNTDGSKFVRFDNSTGAIGSITQATSSTVAYNTSSDSRLKTDLGDFNALDIIKIGKSRKFKFNDDENETPIHGFFAQELIKILPYAVYKGGDDPKNDPWGVDYSKLTGVLWKAIQEQQEIIEEQKQENNLMKNWICEQDNAPEVLCN